MTPSGNAGSFKDTPYLYWTSLATWSLLNFPVWCTTYRIVQSGDVFPLVDLGGFSFGFLGWLCFRRFAEKPSTRFLTSLGLATLLGFGGSLVWAIGAMLSLAGIAEVAGLQLHPDGERGYLIF